VYVHVHTKALKEMMHVQVQDLVDVNGVKHGKPGYTNEEVQVNDRLLAIDGVFCEHLVRAHDYVPVTMTMSLIYCEANSVLCIQELEKLHQQLRGERYTQVRLTFGRGNGKVFDVTVMRHAYHEFDRL
jgi:hypothetical protein